MDKNFWVWISDNLNWIVPVFITAIFSVLNIRVASVNQKLSENQLKLQNDSFCFELLERRMEVYLSIKEVLSSVSKNGTVTLENISAFMNAYQKSYFLFDNEIDKKLESIGQSLLELRKFSQQVDLGIRRETKSACHIEACEKAGELLKELSHFNFDLKSDFEPYLSFKKYRIEEKEVKK